MLEIFKGWISAMLCVGIFITFIQLIIPKTSLKKYIYSLIGIITVITLISPIINLLKNDNVEESVSEVIADISSDEQNTSSTSNSSNEDYTNKNEKTIRETFAINLKNDIISKLEDKGIKAITVDLFLTEQYNIEKLQICIGKIDVEKSSLNNVTEVVKYINEQYDLDFSKIEVIEEGE